MTALAHWSLTILLFSRLIASAPEEGPGDFYAFGCFRFTGDHKRPASSPDNTKSSCVKTCTGMAKAVLSGKGPCGMTVGGSLSTGLDPGSGRCFCILDLRPTRPCSDKEKTYTLDKFPDDWQQKYDEYLFGPDTHDSCPF